MPCRDSDRSAARRDPGPLAHQGARPWRRRAAAHVVRHPPRHRRFSVEVAYVLPVEGRLRAAARGRRHDGALSGGRPDLDPRWPLRLRRLVTARRLRDGAHPQPAVGAVARLATIGTSVRGSCTPSTTCGRATGGAPSGRTLSPTGSTTPLSPSATPLRTLSRADGSSTDLRRRGVDVLLHGIDLTSYLRPATPGEGTRRAGPARVGAGRRHRREPHREEGPPALVHAFRTVHRACTRRPAGDRRQRARSSTSCATGAASRP